MNLQVFVFFHMSTLRQQQVEFFFFFQLCFLLPERCDASAAHWIAAYFPRKLSIHTQIKNNCVAGIASKEYVWLICSRLDTTHPAPCVMVARARSITWDLSSWTNCHNQYKCMCAKAKQLHTFGQNIHSFVTWNLISYPFARSHLRLLLIWRPEKRADGLRRNKKGSEIRATAHSAIPIYIVMINASASAFRCKMNVHRK